MRKSVVFSLLGLGVVGGFWLGFGGSTTAQQPPAQNGPPPVPVTADVARKQDFPVFQLGLGQVQAFNTVTIHVRVDGALDKVAFTEGQDVKQGDVLAQIDPRPFQAALDQAAATKDKDAANLANAQRDYDRYVTLAPQNFTSKQVLDTQKALVAQLTAQVKADQAAIDNAKVQLGYTTITAPISGRTGIRLIDQGNIVHATDTTGLVVLTQLHPISVIFTLSETLLPKVSKAMAQGGLKVEAWSQDDSLKLGDGKVALIDNQIDPATGTMKIKATFPNDDLTLWPGQFVNARLLLETRQDGVTIPVAAIQRGPNGTFAWVVKPDKSVEMRPIKIAYSTTDTALVESGIAAGDTVVTGGQYRVVIGGKVEVTMKGPKQTADSAGPAQ